MKERMDAARPKAIAGDKSDFMGVLLNRRDLVRSLLVRSIYIKNEMS